MRSLQFLRALFQRVVLLLRSVAEHFRKLPARDIQGSPPFPAKPAEFEEQMGPYDDPYDDHYDDHYDYCDASGQIPDSWIIPPEPEAVKFTAFWPERVPLAHWTDLLVYLYTPETIGSVIKDVTRRLGLGKEHTAQQTTYGRLKRGTEVIVTPEIEDAEVNPSSASVSWLEPWHHVDFRFRLLGDSAAPRLGQISFYVGPLLVGSVAMSIEVGDVLITEPIGVTGDAYRKIFVSYSHKDRDIVDQLERAATAIGDTYLRDTKVLRSGEEWNAAIMARIDEADVFQLCWSEEAKRSTYVAQEWRHAHHLVRRNFIRPIYWKEPMPEPPAELGTIHFRYVPFV